MQADSVMCSEGLCGERLIPVRSTSGPGRIVGEMRRADRCAGGLGTVSTVVAGGYHTCALLSGGDASVGEIIRLSNHCSGIAWAQVLGTLLTACLSYLRVDETVRCLVGGTKITAVWPFLRGLRRLRHFRWWLRPHVFVDEGWTNRVLGGGQSFRSDQRCLWIWARYVDGVSWCISYLRG